MGRARESESHVHWAVQKPGLDTLQRGPVLSLQMPEDSERLTPVAEGHRAPCIERDTLKSESPGSWHHSLTELLLIYGQGTRSGGRWQGRGVEGGERQTEISLSAQPCEKRTSLDLRIAGRLDVAHVDQTAGSQGPGRHLEPQLLH